MKDLNKKELLRIMCQIIIELGLGHSEIIYQKAFIVYLNNNKDVYDIYKIEEEKVLPLTYMNVYIGIIRVDVLIDDLILIEFKSLSSKPNKNHLLQTKKYLRELNLNVGYLININDTLYVEEVVK